MIRLSQQRCNKKRVVNTVRLKLDDSDISRVVLNATPEEGEVHA